MPQMYPGTVVSTFTRQVGWTDKAVLIDFFLVAEDKAALYAIWKKQQGWPEPLDYRGGEWGITCEMVLEAAGNDLGPEDKAEKQKAFIAAFGKKKSAAAVAGRIMTAACEGAGR